VANDRRADRVGAQFNLRTDTRRSEQIDHARKLIDKGEARQFVADLLNVGRSTLSGLRIPTM
jgi:hypothetical protein